jgi:hypothetical protein
MVFAPDGTFGVERRDNVAPLLEHNKFQQNNPEFQSRGHRRKVADIPGGLYQLWKTVLGDPTSGDPEVLKRWDAKLNSNEWRHLRTNTERI